MDETWKGPSNFGIYIKKLRESKGKRLIDINSVSSGYISRIETGKRKVGSLSVGTIVKISDTLEVDPVELFKIAIEEMEKDLLRKEK